MNQNCDRMALPKRIYHFPLYYLNSTLTKLPWRGSIWCQTGRWSPTIHDQSTAWRRTRCSPGSWWADSWQRHRWVARPPAWTRRSSAWYGFPGHWRWFLLVRSWTRQHWRKKRNTRWATGTESRKSMEKITHIFRLTMSMLYQDRYRWLCQCRPSFLLWQQLTRQAPQGQTRVMISFLWCGWWVARIQQSRTKTIRKWPSRKRL